MDGHHLRVDREWDVGIVASAGTFEWSEDGLWLLLLLLILTLLRFVLLLLQLLLQRGNRSSIKPTLRDTTVLESSAIEARLVVVVAMPNDFPTVNNNTAVLIVQRGLRGLLEAERQIRVSLHFGG